MKHLLILLTAFALLGLSSCTKDETQSWKDAESAASAYLDALKAHDFDAAFNHHHKDSQLRKNTKEADFVGLQAASLQHNPGIFSFDYKLEAQKHTNTSAGIFEFKATLSWGESNAPKLTGAQSIAPEMRITLKEYDGEWKVFVARTWYDLSEEMKKSKG